MKEQRSFGHVVFRINPSLKHFSPSTCQLILIINVYSTYQELLQAVKSVHHYKSHSYHLPPTNEIPTSSYKHFQLLLPDCCYTAFQKRNKESKPSLSIGKLRLLAHYSIYIHLARELDGKHHLRNKVLYSRNIAWFPHNPYYSHIGILHPHNYLQLIQRKNYILTTLLIARKSTTSTRSIELTFMANM